MYKIWIDASERYNKIVRVLDGEKLLSEKSGDIDIVSSIQQIIKENNLETKDIEKIDFNKGPGSFTGLKISATIANVFNWANGKITVYEVEYPNYGREPNITPKKDL